jgi:hypothetical protein
MMAAEPPAHRPELRKSESTLTLQQCSVGCAALMQYLTASVAVTWKSESQQVDPELHKAYRSHTIIRSQSCPQPSPMTTPASQPRQDCFPYWPKG